MSIITEIITYLTALTLTATGVAKPSSLPVVSETIKSIPFDNVVAVAEEYSISTEALTAFDMVIDVSLKEPVIAHAIPDIGDTLDNVRSYAGISSRGSEESRWYCPEIPMKKEHQKLLWDCCMERGLDYIDMLALISLESDFQEKSYNGKYKGYFQICADYGPNLSKTLNTENQPLDGSVNIKWGTAFYSWILEDERVKHLEGKEKRDVALSIYQRGGGGYDRKGLSKKYLETFYKKKSIIISYFDKA